MVTRVGHLMGKVVGVVVERVHLVKMELVMTRAMVAMVKICHLRSVLRMVMMVISQEEVVVGMKREPPGVLV